MKVFACRTGGDRSDLATFDPLDEDVGTKVYCPYFFYLVEHPDGRVLFDTGLHPQIAIDLAGRVGEAAAAAFPIEMNDDGDVVSQLFKLRLAPGDVDAVIQSHLHFDHAGGLQFVKHAEVYVQSAELAAARQPPVYQQDLYNPDDFEHDLKWKLLDGHFDVFGDGKLQTIPTPGHTRGHQSLYIEFENRKPLVLMGDATYSLAKMRQRRLPAVVWSPDEMVASWERLEEIERETGAELRCTHERDFEDVPVAPQAYWG
jgi:N-acyl homoserine lactone hydrolase